MPGPTPADISQHLQAPGPTKNPRTRWLIYVLFFFACVHCARSIFVVNVSLLNLSSYEAGAESMPFQGRVGMMPLLRWAHQDHALQRAAVFFDRSLRNTPHMQNPPEPYTPEKLFCMLTGIASIMAMTWFALRFGRRHLQELWWAPGVLTLTMLYVTYAARYEAQFWYPYDLPHFAIFGIACLCILEDAWIPALLLFFLDLPLRETSIYLAPLVLAVGYAIGRLRRATLVAGIMLVTSLVVRAVISHRFAHNPSDTHIHWLGMARSIGNPLHWPQIASAFGFLALPLYLGRRLLSRVQRIFLVGALPCLAVTLLFGIWYETRIWDEWTLPAAVLLSSQLSALFVSRAVWTPLQRVTPPRKPASGMTDDRLPPASPRRAA